jgi:hypothetical protein
MLLQQLRIFFNFGANMTTKFSLQISAPSKGTFTLRKSATIEALKFIPFQQQSILLHLSRDYLSTPSAVKNLDNQGHVTGEG